MSHSSQEPPVEELKRSKRRKGIKKAKYSITQRVPTSKANSHKSSKLESNSAANENPDCCTLPSTQGSMMQGKSFNSKSSIRTIAYCKVFKKEFE